MFHRKKKHDIASKFKPLSPADDPSSLGNVLIDLGVITRDQLQSVLARQRTAGEGLLGSMICEAGLCTTRDIARAVEIQARMREGREAEASLGFLSAATEEMSATAKELSDIIKKRPRGLGPKPGLSLLKRAG